MESRKIRDSILTVLVAAAYLLVFAVVLVIVFYTVKRIGFFELKIHSTLSAFGFAAGVIAGAAGLGGFGTFLDTLRSHMFNERSRYALIAINKLIQITIFGIYIHFLDNWFNGIELGNTATEVCFTLVIYVFFVLVTKFANVLKARDIHNKRE